MLLQKRKEGYIYQFQRRTTKDDEGFRNEEDEDHNREESPLLPIEHLDGLGEKFEIYRTPIPASLLGIHVVENRGRVTRWNVSRFEKSVKCVCLPMNASRNVVFPLLHSLC